MNNIRIQNYLDNQLSQSELEQFAAELASNPTLKKEVEALKTFKSHIQNACLSEQTPNLLPILSNITRPTSINWLNKVAPLAIAGIAIFAIGLAANRVVIDQTNPTVAIAKSLPTEAKLYAKSPTVMRWDGNNAVQGAAILRQKFYRPIPTITLSNLEGSNFRGTECGSCWINFIYDYKGKSYNIYGRCEKGNLNSGLIFSSGNQTFYTFKDAVGWYDKDMTYVCTGGNELGRNLVAKAAAQQTSNLH